MEIIIGVILYLVVVFSFMAFGRFLKDCDESMLEQIHKDTSNTKFAK